MSVAQTLAGGVITAIIDGVLDVFAPSGRIAEPLPTNTELGVMAGSLIFYGLAKASRNPLLENLAEGSVLYSVPMNVKRTIVRSYWVATK